MQTSNHLQGDKWVELSASIPSRGMATQASCSTIQNTWCSVVTDTICHLTIYQGLIYLLKSKVFDRNNIHSTEDD